MSESPLGELLFMNDDSEYVPSQRLFGIRADERVVSGCYIYFWLKTPRGRDDLMVRATGTTVVGIRQFQLRKVQVLKPSSELIRRFDEHAQPLLRELASVESMNASLAIGRDTLLPKLLSGELTIPDVEKLAADVL